MRWADTITGMHRPWVEVAKWPYEEEMQHFQVAASNGLFTATQDFYANVTDVEALAESLKAFPRSSTDEVRFEVGSTEPGQADSFSLRAWLYDPVGHAALTFAVCSVGKDPWRQEARFTIRCQVASLNRLGASLLQWVRGEQQRVREELTPVDA
jgi:hypothetical protein